MGARAVVLIAILCVGCSDAYEPFAAIKVGMSKAEVIALVGEPDDVKDVADLPPEDTCREAEGDELLLYRLEDSTLRFWQRSAERTVRVCLDSQEKVVRKDVQIITR